MLVFGGLAGILYLPFSLLPPKMPFYQSTQNGFQHELNRRIERFFTQKNQVKYGNRAMYFKITLALTAWSFSLTALYLLPDSISELIFLFLLHALTSLFVIFNIGHDAVHQAISRNKKINNALSWVFNLLGGNRYSWYLKHNIGHHRYTNIHSLDPDIDTTPLFRVSPHTKLLWHYRFQHLYIIPLYCLLSLVLIFVFDLKVFYRNPEKIGGKEYFLQWLILISTKLGYLFYMIYLPWQILPLTLLQVLVGFFAMHGLLGLCIALVLLPSHFIGGTRFYRKPTSGCQPQSWAEHQLLTTVDIAPKSRLLNFLLGGLNTNVLHHIYPKLAHIHLPELSILLEKTAQDFNIPYKKLTLKMAIVEHFRFLKRMGNSSLAEQTT